MAYNVFNTNMAPDPVTVGVAFGGGGVRSFTEISGLRDMKKKGLPLTAVAGTSMGAAVAALVACGLELDEIEQQVIKSEARMLELGFFKANVRMLFPKSSGAPGMVDANIIAEFFGEIFQDLGITRLSQLKMPTAFVSVDLKTMKPLIFSNVPAWFKGLPEVEFYSKDILIANAVAASCAFPLAISAIALDDYLLVDGGVRLNIPTPIFSRELIDVVVAVSPLPQRGGIGNTHSPLNIGLRSVDCMADQLDRLERALADISIEIPVEAEIFDFGKGTSLIESANNFFKHTAHEYKPYFALVKEREEDWLLEKEEIAARLAEEKALKEKESAERKGWRGLFKRVTGQGQ